MYISAIQARTVHILRVFISEMFIYNNKTFSIFSIESSQFLFILIRNIVKLQINFKITNIMYVELSVRATSLLLFDSLNLFLIVKPQTQCERLAITIEITRFQPIRIRVFPCIWFLIDWNRVIPIAIAIPSYYIWGLRVLTQQNRNRSLEMSTIHSGSQSSATCSIFMHNAHLKKWLLSQNNFFLNYFKD